MYAHRDSLDPCQSQQAHCCHNTTRTRACRQAHHPVLYMMHAACHHRLLYLNPAKVAGIYFFAKILAGARPPLLLKPQDRLVTIPRRCLVRASPNRCEGLGRQRLRKRQLRLPRRRCYACSKVRTLQTTIPPYRDSLASCNITSAIRRARCHCRPMFPHVLTFFLYL